MDMNLEKGPDTVQRIAKETVEALRAMQRHLDDSTGKVERAVIAALQKSGVNDRLLKMERRQGTFTNALKRGLTQVIKNLEGE